MQENPIDKAAFFTNKDCPHFPCHMGINPEKFNCMFCYCPLYALGTACGGDYRYTLDGIKDCSECTIMHYRDTGALRVQERFNMLSDLASDSGE